MTGHIPPTAVLLLLLSFSAGGSPRWLLRARGHVVQFRVTNRVTVVRKRRLTGEFTAGLFKHIDQRFLGIEVDHVWYAGWITF